jgi:hypothetical protein
MAEMFCRHLGIGVLYFYQDRLENDRYSQDIEPKINENDVSKNWSFLTDRHKDYAQAGNADGKRLTKFANTCINMRNVLRHFPDGLPIRKLVSMVDHHYSCNQSAQNALRKLIPQGIVPGIKTKMVRNRYIAYLSEDKS